jgi:hypothetical protein
MLGDRELPLDRSLLTVFHTSCIPSISITSYMHRLARYTECSEEGLIQAVLNIYRLMQGETGNAPFQVNAFNAHRLLLTSLLCTSKFFDDHYFNNAFYARVGGITTSELNMLEVEFLSLVNFDLFLPAEQYGRFVQYVNMEQLHHNCPYKHARYDLDPSLIQTCAATAHPSHAHSPPRHMSDAYAVGECSPDYPSSPVSPVSPLHPSHYQQQHYQKLPFTRTISPTSAYALSTRQPVAQTAS